MVCAIIFVLLCLPHTLISQNSIKPLQKLAAEKLLNKWSSLPNNELPSDEEIGKIPLDIQKSMLWPKSVYQFFAFKALSNCGQIDKDEDTNFAHYYTSTELELMPDEVPTATAYSTDIQRALIQVKRDGDTPEYMALLYSFDNEHKKYKSSFMCPAVQQSSMSKNGTVLALHKHKKSDPQLCEFVFQFLQQKAQSPAQTITISKKLAQGEAVENIALNNDGSVFLLSTTNPGESKTKNLSIWYVDTRPYA